MEAEQAHYFSMNLLRAACSIRPIRYIISKCFTPNHPDLVRTVFGLPFRNPVGLGAGFDKNASYLRELETLGFGFVEIGTVTPLPQAGNEKPRSFRLPADKALINRMGFNNDGVKVIRERLEEWKNNTTPHPPSADKLYRKAGLGAPSRIGQMPSREGELGNSEQGTGNSLPAGRQGIRDKGLGRMIIGGNIGKNKNTPNEEAWKDYEICFNELFDVVDYFVVNVSSPNTPGLRALQDKDALLKILGILNQNNRSRPERKPLLLKIAPDLTPEQLKDIAEIADEINLDGIVSSNTTISRERLSSASKVQAEKIGMGGLSGKPLKEVSDEVLQELVRLTKGQLPIIASGGIFKGEDAKDKLNLGATMVQVWTGFIYEGPTIVNKICKKINF
jgi:dihydroorotate dehydrogenase